jgi:D-serine deaminase-like pyridoxal phosphate-dependent protein
MMRPVWLLLAAFLTASAWAEPPVEVAPKPAAKKPAGKLPAAQAKAKARPAWAELTAEQQKTLAPLKADWESLETERRRKWVGIAKRYPTMAVGEQERVQRRMQAWAKLSPEQRRQARETYKQIVKVPPEKRGKLREQWAEYQSLPPREREEIAPEPRRKK